MFQADALQDIFVTLLLSNKINGTYVDIGSCHSMFSNNTFYFSQMGWKGICVDSDQNYIDTYKDRPNSNFLCADATELDYVKLFSDSDLPKSIDYLSLDVDTKSLDVLNILPFSSYEFKVITIEHDAYIYGDVYRKQQREILEKNGYLLVGSNVKVPAQVKENSPFEDWWVKKGVLPTHLFNLIKTESLYPDDIIKLLINNRKLDLDFGVFFTCFTEKESVKFALELLYKLYSDIPVYLVSDGGEDYSELEHKFTNLKCTLSHDSRGFVPKIPDFGYEDAYWQDLIIKSIYEFLERLKNSFIHTNKPYILIMEPDVLVRGKLSIPFNARLLGSKVNPRIKKEELINQYLTENGGVSVQGYGATPAIVERESFMEVYEFVKQNPKVISDLSLIDQTLANYDVLLPVLFALKGHIEVINDEIVECYRDPNWQNNGKPLVHQFRIYYPKESYTGRHTNR